MSNLLISFITESVEEELSLKGPENLSLLNLPFDALLRIPGDEKLASAAFELIKILIDKSK